MTTSNNYEKKPHCLRVKPSSKMIEKKTKIMNQLEPNQTLKIREKSFHKEITNLIPKHLTPYFFRYRYHSVMNLYKFIFLSITREYFMFAIHLLPQICNPLSPFLILKCVCVFSNTNFHPHLCKKKD